MQASSLSTQVLLRTPRYRRTSSSSSSRSTGEVWADSSIGWHLLINSKPTLNEGDRVFDEHGVLGLLSVGLLVRHDPRGCQKASGSILGGFLLRRLFGLGIPIRESRRADSNRFPCSSYELACGYPSACHRVPLRGHQPSTLCKKVVGGAS